MKDLSASPQRMIELVAQLAAAAAGKVHSRNDRSILVVQRLPR